MVTERMIINALILAASFILVPFIISEALTVDYLPMLIFAGLVGLGIAFFVLKEKLSMCPFLGMSVFGTMNFLPVPLNAMQIACIFVILYYITGYVIIKQKPIKLGKTTILWPLAIVLGIVFYHNHSLSLGSLGGNSEGARPAIFMYMITLAYICAINLPTPSVEFMSRLPLYSLVITIISSFPYLLTTVAPGTAPALYNVTNSVNVEAYVDSVNGGGGTLSKLAAFGPVGSCMQMYLMCHYPMGTWLRPRRLWMALVSVFCAVMVASSGYRSEIFSYFTTLLIGAWCYYSWRALVLPVFIVVLTFGLITAVNDNIINLPLRQLPFITQRTLSFLPGDWDPDAIESGKNSDEFRDNIKKVYINEYMAKSPWFGNGFDINIGEFSHWGQPESSPDAEYRQAKTFIEGKLFHTGWMSVYDCVGIVGIFGFVAFAFNLMYLNARFIFGPRADQRSSLFPLYIWIFCNLLAGFIGYWTVFGSFPDEVMGLLVFAMILSHLSDLAQKTDAPVVPIETLGNVEVPRISGAYYGRR